MKRISRLLIQCFVVTLLLAATGLLFAQTFQAQSPAPQGNWSAKATLPVKLSEVAVAAAGGKIFVLGGSTPDVVDLRLNEEYDPATDRWRERTPLPRGLTHAGATGFERKNLCRRRFHRNGSRRRG